VEWQSFGERAPGVPLKPDDIFAIASLTKIVTTVGALVLVEEGRLGIDDPIATHLPEFKDPKVAQGGPAPFSPPVDAVRPITLRHLLTHTAGLSGSTPLKDADIPLPRRVDGDFTSLADMTRELAARTLQHQPGEKWVYGPATDVLGRLIEVVSGKPFDVFLDERVLRPLKMRDTSFAVPPSKQARRTDRWRRWHRSRGSIRGRPDRAGSTRRRRITSASPRCCSMAANSTACGSSVARRSS
jgi:CubicO group peptidase (beta-lactamase class C family)